MLKIKNCLVNEDEIKYIEPQYFKAIYIKFKDDSYLDILFDSQEKRDKELNRVLTKVGDNNVG